ncbi:MAG: response regulator [Desulfuromonadaceae bacterium]|jgi:two-component system chemotaxis response regulator CheY|nr:response regulator [Desulfuromonas sp.]MDY0184977.1 response regulator [Desulfuromonadaceae bacterium]
MKRIIIADDSGTARMMIRRCLEIIGFNETIFEEAKDGREALALMKKNPPDLLVSDLNMPSMDGETLLQWVKASPKLVNIPVLIISSVTNPAKTAELKKKGAFAVIGKPINPALLNEALAPLLPE